MVDKIFNLYMREAGNKEPYFSQYCNGTTSTCTGLSQWGTVELANQKVTPIEILKTYYPKNVEIVADKSISGITNNYPR